ncbi:MAG: [FeFe] hydrogenase H-cluster maturation GTPase HydF, partial [Eubacterium sp.]|nr:[FeFe] hydrogenase H-cluster maturation GTPase HydF [Eubacterium sp.]
VKLPNWLKQYTNKELKFEFTSGGEFPESLSEYALVIHCGGCMLNEKEMLYRQKSAESQNIPFTNYGTAIAYMNGILKRSLELFPDIYSELN